MERGGGQPCPQAPVDELTVYGTFAILRKVSNFRLNGVKLGANGPRLGW